MVISSIRPRSLKEAFDLSVAFLLLVGLGLTILSHAKICSSACAAVHQYKFMGFEFELLGFIFFSSALLLHLFNLKFLTAALVAGALGAELNFIGVQKYLVEGWCPLCLTIAGIVGLIALLLMGRFFYDLVPITKEKIMKGILKTILMGAFFVLGFAVAFYAVFKPQDVYAEEIGNNMAPYFGKADSPVEVYIISDWFCKACIEKEPQLEKLYPEIMKDARLYFIDYAVHPQTTNFIPYNLSFILQNKKDYFNVRKALHELAHKTKSPTQAEVEEAVKAYGVTYTPLNFSDINEGMKFMEGVTKTFKIKATPTVVVANQKALKARKFKGSAITADNIKEAINEMKEAR